MAQFVRHELGVHLGQPALFYLQDVGLGYSAIKENFLSPVEWWDKSAYNPKRTPEPFTPAFFRGEALHLHVLEGVRLYDKTFAVLPTAESHPDYLDTVAQLAQACARHGLSTHGLKGELIARLVKAKAPVKILEHERYIAGVKKGRRSISIADDRRIRVLDAMIRRNPKELLLPDGDHLTLADALKNALTEVSIYWVDENGIRQRARFDGLKPNITLDLKSITNWRAGNFRRDLLREAVLRGYIIQQAHYREARQQLRIAVDEGRVFGGNKTQRKRLAEIAAAEEWAWLFIFAKMDGAPQVRGIILDHVNSRYTTAAAQRQEALAMHAYYREVFEGYETPWFDPEVIWTPEEEDWPLFTTFGQSN